MKPAKYWGCLLQQLANPNSEQKSEQLHVYLKVYLRYPP